MSTVRSGLHCYHLCVVVLLSPMTMSFGFYCSIAANDDANDDEQFASE